jgi:hypothetical protein
MKTRSALVLSLLVLTAIEAPAFAQHSIEEPGGESAPEGGRFGVGAEAVLLAPFAPAALASFAGPQGAISAGFDAGNFRVDGLLSLLFQENSFTAFAVGGRFFYVLHRAKSADFSIGGGLVLGVYDPNQGDSQFRVGFDFAGQIRAFLTSNVALTGTLGLGFSVGQKPFIFGILGQLIGGLGIVYYF